MITRIMMVGPGRIYEAACSLSFDHNLSPSIDQTIVVSPYSWVTLTSTFLSFGINVDSFKFVLDVDCIEQFELQDWKHHWYLQQGIKLSLLDTVDSDKFLIQDCDVFAIKPYKFFKDDIPCFRVEELWNDYQLVYAEKVEKLIGYSRKIPYSFVTEFMPYTKDEWNQCKQHIEHRFSMPWKAAIKSVSDFDDTKWFSEYEMLGMYKTNTSTNYAYETDTHPELNTLTDLRNADWSMISTVKFKARPFKYMVGSDALLVKNFFKQLEE